jgi:hypothetical protein
MPDFRDVGKSTATPLADGNAKSRRKGRLVQAADPGVKFSFRQFYR